MVLEGWLPALSLTFVTLISVYTFDWIFIFLDQFVSPIIKHFLEEIFSSKIKDFKFSGFFLHIPNFIFFMLCIIFVFPWIIKYSYNHVTPFMQNFANDFPFFFFLVMLLLVLFLYLLFIHMYYKQKKQDLENVKSKIIRA